MSRELQDLSIMLPSSLSVSHLLIEYAAGCSIEQALRTKHLQRA